MSLFPEVDKEIETIRKAEAEKLKQIKDESEIYRPSNGTEGMIFESEHCATCSKDNPENEKLCDILGIFFANGSHEEIRKYKGITICFSHSKFDIKEFMKERR